MYFCSCLVIGLPFPPCFAYSTIWFIFTEPQKHAMHGHSSSSTVLSIVRNHPPVTQKLNFQPKLGLRATHIHVCRRSSNGLVTASQARRRKRALLELTKPLVTEGLHLLLLCEVVCRRRKDTVLALVRPRSARSVRDSTAAISTHSTLSQWLSFCAWNTPRILRKTTGSTSCSLCNSLNSAKM